MCKDVVFEGYFIEFLRSIRGVKLKNELWEMIIHYKQYGVFPKEISDKAKPFSILISTIIDNGTYKETEEECAIEKKKSNKGYFGNKNAIKKQNENKTKTNENKTKTNENKTKTNENKTETNENKTETNENKTDFFVFDKEKEKTKEKEISPYNPLKEKENKKEKENDDADAHACEGKSDFDFSEPQRQSKNASLNTESTEKEKEKSCGQKEKEICKPSFEEEVFNKPLPYENQKNANDWQGQWEQRFESNLNDLVGKTQWREFSKQRFSDFTKTEKKEIFAEFILRNATDRKYTAIYYDRDLQNEQRKHLISFLNIKLNLKRQNEQPKEQTFIQRVADKLKTQGVI